MHACMHAYVCVIVEFEYKVNVETPVCLCVVGGVPRSPVLEGRAMGSRSKLTSL
jgi:hypothetical protein